MSSVQTINKTTAGVKQRRIPAWLPILLCALAGTAAEIFLKRGAVDSVGAVVGSWEWLNITGLTSSWTWVSIIFTLLSFGLWLQAIRMLPLSVAFSLSNVVHVFIPLSAFVFLHEAISLTRGAGISLIVVGLWIVAKPYSKLDSNL